VKKIVVGNWKLYVNSLKEGKKLLQGIDKKYPRGSKADVVICPPQPLAVALKAGYGGKRLAFGAQDASYETEGAHTGESSPTTLAAAGLSYVILGHSERRATGETDDVVAKKVAAALAAKLKPIICVSERERDPNAAYLTDFARSIGGSLARIGAAEAKNVIIAYEPVWAIGGEETPPPRLITEAVVFIRKTLAELWGREAAFKTRILYGGSVNADNVSLIAEEAKVDGVLVGHHSVDPEAFAAVIRAFT
jgi:triosephosphate isomerase